MSALPGLTRATETAVAWRDLWEAFRASRPAGEPEWLGALRAAAFGRFEELGFPTTREEAWRHTSVAPIARRTFRLAQPAPVGAFAGAALADLSFGDAFHGHQLVLVNGRYAPELSSHPSLDGVAIRSLREVLDRERQRIEPYLGASDDPASAFTALNTAFLAEGAFVWVPDGTVLREPIHLVFLSRGEPGEVTPLTSPRVLVVLGRKSQATVVESYGGTGPYFTNAVTEVVAGDGAVVDHYRLQREGEEAFHVGALALRQGRDTAVTSHVVMLGAALSRLDLRQVFEGEGGDCTLDGLFLGSGTQHTDIHTRVDHAQPHCTTRELYKGVLDGRAHGVFVGKVLVRPGAAKTDAQQTNKNLLLSREALVDSLPQLEILNDDVKCKHGSTTGQIDPVALFYLRSRGIGERAARTLLTFAFASDVVARMKVEALRRGLTEHLQRRLPAADEVREAVL